MLNSNFFSKKYFKDNLIAFELWLRNHYNVSYIDDTDYEKQVSYYHHYISFLNYRQKYIQDSKRILKEETKNDSLLLINKELLSRFGIAPFTKFNNL